MRHLFLFILLAGLFFSCQPQTDKPESYEVQLTDSLIFPIDSLTQRLGRFYVQPTDSGFLFVNLNVQGTLLSLINSESRHTEHVAFQREGTESMLANGIYLHTPDSLLVIRNIPPTVYFSNTAAQRLSKHELGVLPNQSGFLIADFFWSTPLDYQRDEEAVYFHFQATHKRSFPPRALVAKYSLANDSLLFTFGKLPAIYAQSLSNKEIFPQQNFPYFLPVDSLVVLGFPVCDSLYAYSRQNGKLLWQKQVQSRFHTPIEPIQAEGTTQDTKNYLDRSAAYGKMLYHKDKKLFFRFFRHRQDLYQSTGQLRRWEDAKWSVLVLNENFELVSESELPPHCHYNKARVCPQGFVVPKTISQQDQHTALVFSVKKVK